MSETGAGAGVASSFDGPGEMRALLRSADRSTHPLGPPSTWPSRLLTLVDVCAGSAVPMAVWWRPADAERVVLCNDACRELLRAGAGRPGERLAEPIDAALTAAWPDVDALVADVVATGRPAVRESWCLAPVRDADGSVAAVHLVAAHGPRGVVRGLDRGPDRGSVRGLDSAADTGPGDGRADHADTAATPTIEDDGLLAHVERLCDGPAVLADADAKELVTRVRAHVDQARARERAVAQAEARVSNLEAALRSNRLIGQAIGILMARRRITEQQAFELLRGHSQHTQRKLRDVAEDVTFTGDLPHTDRA